MIKVHFVCVLYIPPSRNASRAASQIADCVYHQLQRKPEAPIFVVGDFNHCSLNKSLPGFYQYLKCVDKCYSNIKDAYTARARNKENCGTQYEV